MATLLCSMLIGAGYPALVVSGVARVETCLNDQRNTPYPYEINDIKNVDEEPPKRVLGDKYKLREMPDLKSHLDENVELMKKEKRDAEQLVRDQAARLEQEELEFLAVDRYHYRRTHAWVVIIDNASWSLKPKKTIVNEDGEEIPAPATARFIEPATGFVFDTKCNQYILVDSVWDHQNYYVNMQEYSRLDEVRWDLRVVTDWEHLLPGEPPEMRSFSTGSDENVTDATRSVLEEKHLDCIGSWVSKLHIGYKEFEQRFPKLQKTVHYAYTIHERYSPYTQRDGKYMQLTLFSDPEYKEPTLRWEYFEHRKDFLQQIKYYYETGKMEDSFSKGRNDSLRFVEYSTEPNEPKRLHFYPETRIDCLKNLQVSSETIVLNFENRPDRCYYQEFEFKPGGQVLKKAVQKFLRQPDLPAYQDVAIRSFLFTHRKIHLKYHYPRGALTSATLEFNKPPKPDYGKELEYNPAYVKAYKASVNDPSRTSLEHYVLLLEQLNAEEEIKKQFEKLIEDINTIFDLRREEMRHPVLQFSVFDPIRNDAARRFRMQEAAAEEEYKLEMSRKPPDFLAPYLVPYKGRQLTPKESWGLYHACLNDLKSRFFKLLNALQRQYEDLCEEARSLEHFLCKFEDQFDDYNYEKIKEEANNIERTKRMVQQRLEINHESAQKKYDTVKASLLQDPRLNLNSKS